MLNIRFWEVVLIGFLAQIIDGTVGMGYGVTSSSLLISFGIYPAISSASVHASELVVSFVSGISHFKFGNVRKELLWPLISFGIVGGVIGACGLVRLPSSLIRFSVGLILICLGALMTYKFIFKYNKSDIQKPKKYSVNKLRILGFFAAFIDAIGGGGWGPICTHALIVNNTEPNKAVGSVNLAEFFVTLAISATFLLLLGFQKFYWGIVLWLIIGGVISAPIAAFLCKRLPKRLLGILVGIVVIILSYRIILNP